MTFRTIITGGLCLFLGGAVIGGAAEQEVFWGTPNFSYAEKLLPPPQLRELGITYMSHLIYWADSEKAPNQWDDAFLSQRRDRIGQLREQGIVSGIRLGEAHPGARVWRVENGQPYQGRNVRAYPGDKDTDEAYFRYLAKVAQTFKGTVDHYILGDELDMIYGASFRDERKLREYFDFFKQASQIIKREDPAALVVVFPFAWGENLRNAELLDRWGLEKYADGFCMNIAHGDCETPEYLEKIAAGFKALSPKYGLYSNGFGYLSDLLPEHVQASRLAHTMLTIWQTGWKFIPYYTLADSQHPWSSGLYRADLEKGEIVKRKAMGVFTRLGNLLSRSPRLDQTQVRMLGVETPFGPVSASEFDAGAVTLLWQKDEGDSFGLLCTRRMSDSRILRVRVELPSGPEGQVLQTENVVTGEKTEIEATTDTATGRSVAVIEVRDELQILRWVRRS
jgi:hypothetical protein